MATDYDAPRKTDEETIQLEYGASSTVALPEPAASRPSASARRARVSANFAERSRSRSLDSARSARRVSIEGAPVPPRDPIDVSDTIARDEVCRAGHDLLAFSRKARADDARARWPRPILQ